MGYFDKFNNGNGIPFMDERDKASLSDLVGQTVHIQDFSFLNGDNGQYAVFIVAEDPKAFYFGNSVITDVLQQIAADGMQAELPKIGVKLVGRKSKRGRDYIAVEFAEDEIPF